MGIGAAIAGVSAAAGAVNTVSNLVSGGSGANPAASLNTALGTGISAASQLQAGQIQADAAQSAIEQQTGVGQQVTGQYNPFLSLPGAVTPGLENLLGVGPSGTAGMLQQLQATPGYQFALTQGNQQVLSQLSSMGLAKSGSALKGVANYTEGLAGTTYNNMVSNFLNSGTLGLNATNSYANAMFGNQSALNALTLNKGAASASGLVGAGNVINSGLNNLNAINPNAYPTPTTTPTTPGANPFNGGLDTSMGPMYSEAQLDRMIAANNPQYITSNQASQNPYQIQAPTITPGAVNTNDPQFSIPTLPTG